MLLTLPPPASRHIVPPSLLALLMVLPCASAGTVSDANAQIPNVSNTDHQCVLLARKILGQEGTDAAQDIPLLIECLKGEYFYFENGAAKIALVHIGQPAIPALIEVLAHPNFYISEGAAMALGQMGARAKEAVPALGNTLRRKGTPLMLQPRAAEALGKIGEIDLLVRILQGEEPGIPPHLGAQGLEAAGPAAASAVPALMEALKSPDTSMHMYAAEALGEIGPAANPAVPQLAELSRSSWNFLQRAGGEALLKIGTPQAQTAGRPYQRRKQLFEGFFNIMSIFVWNPLLALGVGVGLGILALFGFQTRPDRKIANGSLLLPAVAWMLYSVWEYDCKRTGANIRIDLFVIYPFLAMITLLGVGIWLVGLVQPKNKQL